MFLICISENAKDELQNKNINELDKIYKSLERLSNGLWKNGTRVKKLHAVNKNKCIYEARVDKARRMLFSIKSDDMSYENIEKSIIYIHNICVEHDDVIFKAKNILGNDYSENDYILEVENKINMKQLLVEEKTYKNQYEVYFYIDENKFHILTEDDYLRFFNKKNDTKKDIINFQLKLTKEQEKILKNHYHY
ncbi:hypothetical protein Z969_08905 [Clostridium novyi A str. 4570]|uniref:Uncharacterized protein n=1 Tax=Clostridium novyi A str. 4570 TaxID=1444290 RepID=A0AA88ZMQ3_CLONO|nr:hypothetical protein [Clostridium novyi]KGN00963.1 hypothetical protein Z969_08905 [Clostridium novyi A str. 4570]